MPTRHNISQAATTVMMSALDEVANRSMDTDVATVPPH